MSNSFSETKLYNAALLHNIFTDLGYQLDSAETLTWTKLDEYFILLSDDRTVLCSRKIDDTICRLIQKRLSNASPVINFIGIDKLDVEYIANFLKEHD